MKPFRHRFRVPFHQLDPGGVLFFGHLFNHAHQAYESLMETCGHGLGQLLREGRLAVPVVHAEADYQQPLRLDDQVEVLVCVRAMGEHSFTLDYRFQVNGRSCASATTTHVTILRDSREPIPLPDSLIHALEDYRCSSS